MNVNNAPKLLGLMVALITFAVLFGLDKLSESAFVGLSGLIVGYLVGNGIAARNGQPVEPILTETFEHQIQRKGTE